MRKRLTIAFVAVLSTFVVACGAVEDEVRQRADEEIDRQQQRIEDRVDEEIDEQSTRIEDRAEEEVTRFLEDQ